MDKKDLANILSESLEPLGFKKKGSYWVRNSDEVNAIVSIQKSLFGNVFYINYGFVLNRVPLDGLKEHVFGRVSSPDPIEMRRIIELLNFDSSIPDQQRKEELRHLLLKRLIPTVNNAGSEGDVLQIIEELPTLNGVPLVVKKHVGLPLD